MTALRPMACSRNFPMNDLFRPTKIDAIGRDRLDGPTESRTPPKRSAHARSRRGRRLFALGGFALLVVGLSLGGGGKYSLNQQVTATTRRAHDFVPSLRVATVVANPATVPVNLPGTTEAFASANIYARATGYIAKRNVDIGDRVKQGELLVELAVPELDDQISQNEATLIQLTEALKQAQANSKLAQVPGDPDRPLVKQGWVTQQQGTVDVETVNAQAAAVRYAESNVKAQEHLL